MIPFNKPYITGNELKYIASAHERGQLAGDSFFTKECSAWLEKNTGCHKALLTHSCTAALEIAAILADIQPGDEIIMPSYTFVSTANAFVLRGGVPVFVDIRPDTLNINELLIESAVTPRTKAIVPVHYAGVGCEMDVIMNIAAKYDLLVIEDAAQAILSSYKGRPLGSIGDLGCYSFHETKNIISGEGGALLINNPKFIDRAEIIREKGTNRSKFFRGMIDKYSWVDIGSSYLPGELIAAFLWAQMECAEAITSERLQLWHSYKRSLRSIPVSIASQPTLTPSCTNFNAHIYYLILKNLDARTGFIEKMKLHGIDCVFHYVPLHDTQFALDNCRMSTNLSVTSSVSSRLVRLPLWVGLGEHQSRVVEAIYSALE